VDLSKFFQQAEELFKAGDELLPRIRIDSGKDDFDKRWGYTALESIKENVLHDQLTLGK